MRHSIFIAIMLLLAAPRSGAASFQENFATAPTSHGWRVFGNTNLFRWDAINQNLDVTWDSSKSNSYLYYPLGTLVDRYDDFSMALELQLDSILAGVNPAKPSTFPLTFGFFNIADATRPGFLRGSGYDSPNLVEFDFYPDTGFGPTIWPAVWSTNSSPNYNGPNDYTILDLPVGIMMRISMSYAASNQTVTTTITTNGISIGEINPVTLTPVFTDFHAGVFAISSYVDDGQHPLYGGSLIATGVVDNVEITMPPPPVENVSGSFVAGTWQTEFSSRTNWIYTLERATNLADWSPASARVAGTGGMMVLQDTNGPLGAATYRVKAEKP